MKVALSLESGPVPLQAKGADLPLRKTKLQLQSALCFEQVPSSRERAALLRDRGHCAFWCGLGRWLSSGDRERWCFRGLSEILRSSTSVPFMTVLLGALVVILRHVSPGSGGVALPLPRPAPSPERQGLFPLASL